MLIHLYLGIMWQKYSTEAQAWASADLSLYDLC